MHVIYSPLWITWWCCVMQCFYNLKTSKQYDNLLTEDKQTVWPILLTPTSAVSHLQKHTSEHTISSGICCKTILFHQKPIKTGRHQFHENPHLILIIFIKSAKFRARFRADDDDIQWWWLIQSTLRCMDCVEMSWPRDPSEHVDAPPCCHSAITFSIERRGRRREEKEGEEKEEGAGGEHGGGLQGIFHTLEASFTAVGLCLILYTSPHIPWPILTTWSISSSLAGYWWDNISLRHAPHIF